MSVSTLRDLKYFIRLLPTVDRDYDCIKIMKNRQALLVRQLCDVITPPLYGEESRKLLNYWEFKASEILTQNQYEVYQNVLGGCLGRTLKGTDLLVIACGQSMSGKTFTMSGIDDSYENIGLIPRFINDLFKTVETRKNSLQIRVIITYVEILNNQIKDLLQTKETKKKLYPVYRKVVADSSEAALELLFRGEASRHTTGNGRHSAFAVFTITLQCRSLVVSRKANFEQKLHFIDCPGVDIAGNSDRPFHLQGAANLSKTYLEQVILQIKKSPWLSSKGKVNSRSCKLIQYIGADAFEKSILRMVVHIRPTHEDLAITLSMLHFGNTLCQATAPFLIGASHPQDESADPTLGHLKMELEKIKDELLTKAMIQGEWTGENITQMSVQQVMSCIEDYFNGSLDTRELLSIAEPSVLLVLVKRLRSRDLVEIKKLQSLIEEYNRKSTKSFRSPTVPDMSKGSIKRLSRRSVDSMDSPSTHASAHHLDIAGGHAAGHTPASTLASWLPPQVSEVWMDPDEIDELAGANEEYHFLEQKDQVFAEFLKHNASIRMNLMHLESAVEDAFNERQMDLNQVQQIKSELLTTQVQLDTEKLRRNTLVETGQLGAHGRFTTYEEDTLVNLLTSLTVDFDEAKEKLNQSQAKFSKLYKQLIEFRLNVETSFQQYLTYLHPGISPETKEDKINTAYKTREPASTPFEFKDELALTFVKLQSKGVKVYKPKPQWK